MALSIKSDEADQLARALAAVTGESLTEAVVMSLRERLDRQRAMAGPMLTERMHRLQEEAAGLPLLDVRPPDDIVGYDAHGLPA
jgi:antitoxin VapB